MLRRRILESIFKFTSDPNTFNFAYGIQLDPEQTLEIGQYVGLHQVPVLIDGETYYKLSGTNNGDVAYVDVAMYNFTTTQNNQEVTFIFKSSCENPNDFIGATELDSTNKNDLAVKLTGVNTQTYTYTVANAGSHFIKVFYYQHNDGQISGDNAGYFRMIPYYKVNYSYRYKAPNIQNFTIKSYYGWNLISKPEWINIGKEQNSSIVAISSDTSGTHNLKIEALGNPGAPRSGNLVLTEKYGGQSLTLPIIQEGNPHPNDIILTRQRIAVPDDYNPTEDIGIELIGNTSYTISNVSSGLSIIDQTTTGLKINTSGVGTPQNDSEYTFRITGNAGTVKDIVISKEGSYLNCYCDCNSFDGCGCHSQSTFTHKDTIGSSESCPKHDPNQGVACASHTACWCDCNQHRPCSGECNNCPCNSQCEDCVNCSGKNCSCYGQCNHCGDCASHYNSYGDRCTCYSNYVNGCSSQCPGNFGCECDHKYGSKVASPYYGTTYGCGGHTLTASESQYSDSNPCSIYSMEYPTDCTSWGDCKYGKGAHTIATCVNRSTCGCNQKESCYLYSSSYGWDSWPECSHNGHNHRQYPFDGVNCESHTSSGGCQCWSWFTSCHDSVAGCSTNCSGNNGCSCNTQCIDCYNCSCHGQTYNTSCNSHCPSQYNSHRSTCTCNRNYNTECTSQNCSSKTDTCGCNQKTYYPYCSCDQYCKCDGYTVPTL